MDPTSLGDSFVSVTAGLLACIGDVAALNFVPVFEGERTGVLSNTPCSHTERSLD